MSADYLQMQEPVRLASILEESHQNLPHAYVAQTKIIATVGNESRSVEKIEELLNAGMSVARFDFSSGDAAYHQETLENLKAAVKTTKRLCSVMFDTVGPELQIYNSNEGPLQVTSGQTIMLTPDKTKAASAAILPTNYPGLAKTVKKGDTIFVGQYLFTGSETTSVWLEVEEVRGDDVIGVCKNDATLQGALLTAHTACVRVDLPTLSEEDKKNISTWGQANQIDFVSLSFTRTAEDVKNCREHLSKCGELYQTHVLAKIETLEGLRNFDEILAAADGIILGRGNLGIDVPPETVFLFQKLAIHRCNMAGKPCIVTRVVDTMTDTPRPTRAEATDVANAVLDGCDAIMLGAETLRGLYPVETVITVRKICAEAENVYNHNLYFKRIVKEVGVPMSQMESIASSAVRAAAKIKASVIIVFSSSGRAARLIAKYRPDMPVLTVVIPKLTTNQLKWTFTGAFQARQCLIMRGLFPMLADPRHPADGNSNSNESILKVAIDYARKAGLVHIHDRIVVCQKLGDSSVVKIIEIDD
ncbi:pyruvate kinase [Klebsormidium nitens]|uniref:Pyruvate kinase n=1 Tax=Klebsormidium nitens TaxID=105231 RepID=A0A1Y1I256_KLENI|nr:pyruvate kinase [Klebsormidium nitens]|eukprot:GAQ85010.1 pyruvate kinase [Klebsormidium nitens]